MKKIALFSAMLFIALFISCSNDDDASAKAKLVTRITTTGAIGNRLYIITHDDKNRIETVATTGALNQNLTFTYENNLIKTMTVVKAGATKNYIFTYGSNKKLTSFNDGTTNVPVTYDETNNIYQFDYTRNEVFNYNAAGDLTMRDGRTYSYDNSKTGAINSKADYYMVALLADDYWLYIMTKKPMNAMTIPGGEIREFESIFTDDALTQLIISEGSSVFMDANYEYAEETN